MDSIKFIAVGGTIDKVYFDAKSTYQVGTPNIEIMLQGMAVNFPYTVDSLLRKDSLEMTDEDRQAIVESVKAASEQKIIITHGTDTMPETAKCLVGASDKVVVLTGALEPAMFKTSDAMFNVGCAIGAVQSLSVGVYIAMNGQIFAAGNVYKDREKARFLELPPKNESAN